MSALRFLAMIDESRFADVAAYVAQQTRTEVQLLPLKSTDVESRLNAEGPEVMLIHTHQAIRAELAGSYRIIGYSTDTKNNRVAFLVPKGASAQALQDLRHGTMLAPGGQSLTSAVATAMLARIASAPKIKRTQYQDSVPYAVERGFAHVGVTRLTTDDEGNFVQQNFWHLFRQQGRCIEGLNQRGMPPRLAWSITSA